jgi:nucleoside-diphosphate-sugar epimerase
MTAATTAVPKILIIGANGQLGSELALALAERHGREQVVTSDVVPTGRHVHIAHEMLNVTDRGELTTVIERHGITQIYLLAAALSATGEKAPQWAWNLNMTGLLNVLEAARHHGIERVFWPSSIAAFGPPRRASTHRRRRSWSRPPCTASRNRPARAGVAGTSRTMASTCAACATRADLAQDAAGRRHHRLRRRHLPPRVRGEPTPASWRKTSGYR